MGGVFKKLLNPRSALAPEQTLNPVAFWMPDSMRKYTDPLNMKSFIDKTDLLGIGVDKNKNDLSSSIFSYTPYVPFAGYTTYNPYSFMFGQSAGQNPYRVPYIPAQQQQVQQPEVKQDDLLAMLAAAAATSGGG